MKKITFLMLHLNYGGIERQVTTLANELSKDYEVEIISLYDILDGKSFYNLNNRIKVTYIYNYGPNKKKIKECLKRVSFVKLFKELIKSVKMLYTKYFGLKKIISKLDTDVLISSRIEFSKQINRTDCITIAQEHSYIDDEKYIKKVKKFFCGINYLVVMTNKAKEKYDLWLKNCKKRPEVVVIPNIIKENTLGKVSSLNNNQIISIGRLEEVKDFYTLILVFSMVAKKHPKLILKIVGDGTERSTLEELVLKCNLQKNVIFTGRLNEDQVNDELLSSDIFVLTSKSESFSLVLCEAMSFGVPCVSFDIDVGPREIIENNVTGYIVPNRNIDSMIEKINELLDDKEKRKIMGANSKEKAKEFYASNILEKWHTLFQS